MPRVLHVLVTYWSSHGPQVFADLEDKAAGLQLEPPSRTTLPSQLQLGHLLLYPYLAAASSVAQEHADTINAVPAKASEPVPLTPDDKLPDDAVVSTNLFLRADKDLIESFGLSQPTGLP